MLLLLLLLLVQFISDVVYWVFCVRSHFQYKKKEKQRERGRGRTSKKPKQTAKHYTIHNTGTPHTYGCFTKAQLCMLLILKIRIAGPAASLSLNIVLLCFSFPLLLLLLRCIYYMRAQMNTPTKWNDVKVIPSPSTLHTGVCVCICVCSC